MKLINKNQLGKNSTTRVAWIFWSIFVLLSMVLYIPNFIAYYEISTFFPSSTIPTGAWTGNLRLFFIRNNHDIFRIAADFVLVVSLLWFSRNNKKLQALSFVLISVYYILQLYYNIYYEFYQKFYGETPYFINDFALVKEVLPIFLRELSFGYATNFILPFIGFILLTVFIIFLIKLLVKSFQQIKRLKSTKWIFTGLALFILISTFKYWNNPYNPHWPTVQWMAPRILNSMQLKNADKLKTIENEQAYRKNLKLTLTEKPDVFFIFIESYGTVATLSPELDSTYKILSSELSQSLKNEGWHMASAYSISPIKGGRSWLAFTSTLSGVKIENQVQYNDMINVNYDFPHVVRYFNNQGYQTYRMSTMSNVNTDSLIPENKINRFWGFDDWIMYNDIPYEGYKYDYLGGLPDQYALGYFEDEITKNVSAPKFLFFITMTSHGPWYDPPPIVADWRKLDDIKNEKAPELKGESIDRYQKAMEYELRVVTDFIKEKTNKNSIFVLLGDHQPPTLEYKIWDYSDDAATPLHIISKDTVFVNSFIKYGLQPGMNVDISNKQYLQHQGIYSLFLRQLINKYGEEGAELPQYFPNGLE